METIIVFYNIITINLAFQMWNENIFSILNNKIIIKVIVVILYVRMCATDRILERDKR